MELRKQSLLWSAKKMIEKEKALEKKSWTKSKTCVKWVFFAWLGLVIPTMAFPFVVIHLVKDQVRAGKWGDFTVVNPPSFNDTEEAEDEDFNDAFVDIERDFEGDDCKSHELTFKEFDTDKDGYLERGEI
jgi:hypothetical protein